MKITDTVQQVLKNKTFNKVLPISPEQSVHEALSMMAEYDVGALMVMSGQELVGILSERDYARKGNSQGPPLEGHCCRRDYDQPRGLRHAAAHRGRLHEPDDRTSHPASAGARWREGDRRDLDWGYGEVGDPRPGTRHPGTRGLHYGRVSGIKRIDC